MNSEYSNFGEKAGFLKEQGDREMPEGKQAGDFWGYVVVDRSCMDETQKREWSELF